MSGLLSQSQEFVDGKNVAIALFERDAHGEWFVDACNDSFFQLVGMSPADVSPTFPLRLDTLMPDGMPPTWLTTLQACFESGKDLELTHAARHAGSAWRLLLKPLSYANGGTTLCRILLTAHDTVSRARLTHDLEISASRFRAVVDSAYDAIVTIDEAHRITLFNRAAENLFGYSASEVLGQRIELLLPERFRANHSRNVRTFSESPLTSLRSMTAPRMDESNSVYGRHRDGSIIPVEIAISKISVDGVVEFTAVVRDITERAQLMALLKRQAATDALTGLPNRREFIDFVDRTLASDEMLSVFILDIDYFKNINDSFGHDIGDEVLCVLAQAGLALPHASGLFARWGGEEFVAALPGADARAALAIADDLRQRFETQNFEHAWRVKPIPFTVSIGVATADPAERDVDALMRRADRALYRAKERGRNRVEAG